MKDALRSSIHVNGIHVYAYHGCLDEEAIVGTKYTVDISIDFDFTESAEKDDLSLTVDYVVVSKIVQDEMAIRAKLIETVALRIGKSVLAYYPNIRSVLVGVTKHAAPIPGHVDNVRVEINLKGK